MRWNNRKAFAGIGAVVAALFGTAVLRSVIHSVAISGSGGFGAVSLGPPVDLLPLAAGAMVNRVLVRWARRTRGVIRVLHRTHSIMLLLLAGLLALDVILFAALRTFFELLFWIRGLALAAQSFLLAVILFVFATDEPVSPT